MSLSPALDPPFLNHLITYTTLIAALATATTLGLLAFRSLQTRL